VDFCVRTLCAECVQPPRDSEAAFDGAARGFAGGVSDVSLSCGFLRADVCTSAASRAYSCSEGRLASSMQGESDDSISASGGGGEPPMRVPLRFCEARARWVAVGAASSRISFFITLEECRTSEGFGLLGAARDLDMWDVDAQHALARQMQCC
jgi:hypothetical protein